MTVVQIIVANSVEAQLYQSPKAKLLNGDASLQLVKEFSHPESRLKSSELESDRHGNYNNRHTSGTSTFSEHTNLHDIEAEHFAKELAEELEKGRKNNDFQELIIVAAPSFHGLLNKHLSHHVQGLVFLTIEKDYTRSDSKELAKRLGEHL